MELRWTRECGSHRSTHLPNKEAKIPAYRRSLSALRSINDAEEQREVDLAKLFEVYNTCMKDISAELESPHLSKIDKADALIASIAATDILLNEPGSADRCEACRMAKQHGPAALESGHGQLTL